MWQNRESRDHGGQARNLTAGADPPGNNLGTSEPLDTEYDIDQGKD